MCTEECVIRDGWQLKRQRRTESQQYVHSIIDVVLWLVTTPCMYVIIFHYIVTCTPYSTQYYQEVIYIIIILLILWRKYIKCIKSCGLINEYTGPESWQLQSAQHRGGALHLDGHRESLDQAVEGLGLGTNVVQLL